ncbi:MAG: hypothetical protein Q9218_003250 [Villophora microphyllina]
MYSSTTVTLATALLAFTANPALAQDLTTSSNNTDCIAYTIPGNPNATGSFSRAGFASKGSTNIPTGNWVYNTTINVNERNQVWQYFSVDTPNLKGIKNSDIPFQVCTIGFTGLPRNVSMRGQDDNGDCSKTLSPECATALTKLASQSTGAGDDQCGNIATKISSQTPLECQSFGDFGTLSPTSKSNSATDFISVSIADLSFVALFSKQTVDDKCGDPNNTVHDLFGTSNSQRSPTAFNQTEYDEAIYHVVPFLSVVLTKDNASNGGLSISAPPPTLLCMRAKTITPGSRVPAALQDTAATTSRNATAPISGSTSDTIVCTKTIQLDDATQKVTIKTPHLTYEVATVLTPTTRLIDLAKHSGDLISLSNIKFRISNFNTTLSLANKYPEVETLKEGMVQLNNKIAAFEEELDDVMKGWPDKIHDPKTLGFTSTIPGGTEDIEWEPCMD